MSARERPRPRGSPRGPEADSPAAKLASRLSQDSTGGRTERDFCSGCGGTFVEWPGPGRACGGCGQLEAEAELAVRLPDGRVGWVPLSALLEALS